MPTNRIYKFPDIGEAELFLNGWIFGGDVRDGVLVVGKKLHFIAPGPVGTVTFTVGTHPDNPYALRLKDLKAQIEAQVSGISVSSKGGRLLLSGSSGVVVHPTGAADDANALLGFDAIHDAVGKQYAPAAVTATPPVWTGFNVNESATFIYVWE